MAKLLAKVKDNMQTVVAAVFALLLTVLLLLTIVSVGNSSQVGQYPIPSTVRHLLDLAYNRSSTDRSELYEYVALTFALPVYQSPNQVINGLYGILSDECRDVAPLSYEVLYSKEGYIELQLYGPQKQTVAPPVLVLYELNDSGRVIDFAVGNLERLDRNVIGGADSGGG